MVMKVSANSGQKFALLIKGLRHCQQSEAMLLSGRDRTLLMKFEQADRL